ncbi:unnamed protein product [Ambrosiozyma monospora]|uniref:Unnamed protein product n=1 Tax=Ambrosiozyma monospora TaxID=43982 RepID=A0A9W6YQ97_AMBMO|nr:unnamed protein product [Ambrosiozyma monospora]
MAPETELLTYVQHQHTAKPLTTTTTFNSSSKKFYAAQWEEHIIIPSKATNKTIRIGGKITGADSVNSSINILDLSHIIIAYKLVTYIIS